MGKRMMKRFLAVIGMLSVFCLWVSISPSMAERGVTDKVIKVGVISDRSGPCSNTILPLMCGVETWFKWVNSKGGIHGRMIKVYPGDSQFKIAKGTFEAKRLVNKEKVFMLCPADENSAAYKLNFELFKQLNVPILTTVDSRHVPFPPKRLIFEPSPIKAWQLDVVFDYIIHDLKVKKPRIGFIYPNVEYGRVGLRAAKKRLEFYGISESDFFPEVLGFTETNAVSQVMRLKKAKANVVILFHLAKPTAIFIRDADSYGYNPILAAGVMGSSTEDVIDLVGNPQAMKKFIGLDLYSNPLDDDVPGTREIREMVKAFPEAEVYLRSRYLTAGVVLAKIAEEGFRRAGRDLTVDSFIAALESLKKFDLGGLHPSVTFGPDKRYGSKEVSLMKYDMKTNKFVSMTGVRFPRTKPFD